MKKKQNTRDEVRSALESDLTETEKSVLRIATGVLTSAVQIPVVSAIATEVVNRLINQRSDLIKDFVLFLDSEVQRIGEKQTLILVEHEKFRALIDQGADYYCRTDSNSRREYIKRILAKGFTPDVVELEQRKHLLNVLAQIPDPAIVILALHGNANMPVNNGVLATMQPDRKGEFISEEAKAYYHGYKQVLLREGLLERIPNPPPKRGAKRVVNGKMEGETYEEMMQRTEYEFQERIMGSEITSFGLLLLRELGLAKS